MPIGFLGIDNTKIEMLFISPEFKGKGLGKKMVNYAIDKFSVKFVDVNKQNPQALGFYKAMGFIVYNRSDVDSVGNPFPILQMELSSIKNI